MKRQPLASAYKRCSACSRILPRAWYYRDARRPDGLAVQCRPCHIKTVRRSEERHKDRVERYLKARRHG